jgi:hypothetical protein
MIRIVRGSPATLSVGFLVDEEPTDLDQVPTVAVTRPDGSQVTTGAVARSGVGVYTSSLSPQTELGTLTASWSGQLGGDTVSQDTFAEVVGSEYFSIPELRSFDSVLTNTTKYPTDKLIAARLNVENEFEGICGRSFVLRYARENLVGDGTGTLWLSNPEPYRMLTLTVNDDDWSDKTVDTVEYNLRILRLAGHCGVWPRGSRIVIEYEFGKPEAPIRIKQAAMKRAKYQLVADLSRIDERATTMNIPDFGNFVLSTPGMRGSYTGIPEVDVVLQDYVLGDL